MSSTVIEKIENKLQTVFAPIFLKVIDESYLHVDHYPFLGETHFRIIMTSKHFLTMSKLEMHRAIYCVLAEELKSPVHALVIDARSST